jgi:agmatine deiminase
MPAEWAPHERTLMAWPRRRELWGATLEQAKNAYAATANAIARFEPVTLVCHPGEGAEARARTGDGVEILELEIDDSWLRDSGPIYVVGEGGRRAGVHFGFNSWGEKFLPYDHDATIGARLLDHFGETRYEAPLILEGGSIAVDGAGTLLTTEQCLLHPSRNPSLDRHEIDAMLWEYLGVERIVWLGQGLVEDRDTDGHVDLVAAFTRPGHVLLQTVPPGNPNHANVEENKRRLDAAGIAFSELDVLPYVEVEGERVAATAMNFYLCNGGAVVPLAGTEEERERSLEIIAEAYPDREIVGVPGEVLAYGGGGVHCITQQVPAA